MWPGAPRAQCSYCATAGAAEQGCARSDLVLRNGEGPAAVARAAVVSNTVRERGEIDHLISWRPAVHCQAEVRQAGRELEGWGAPLVLLASESLLSGMAQRPSPYAQLQVINPLRRSQSRKLGRNPASAFIASVFSSITNQPNPQFSSLAQPEPKRAPSPPA